MRGAERVPLLPRCRAIAGRDPPVLPGPRPTAGPRGREAVPGRGGSGGARPGPVAAPEPLAVPGPVLEAVPELVLVAVPEAAGDVLRALGTALGAAGRPRWGR